MNRTRCRGRPPSVGTSPAVRWNAVHDTTAPPQTSANAATVMAGQQRP